MKLLRRFWTAFCLYFPFGLLWANKPRHYRAMLGVLWENRGSWRYSWRILNHGVCDGCSLGPYGLKDNVIPGTHLCLTRLGLLKLNTMKAIQGDVWSDAAALSQLDNQQLHALGRLPAPLLRRRGN